LGLNFRPMEEQTQSLKELYEKDYYLWVQENVRLLKNREFHLVDWENLLEEIEGIGRSLRVAMLRQMRKIMEGLYKWENFKEHPERDEWVEEISKARRELREIFEDSPSLKAIAQDKDTLQKAWKLSVRALVDWLRLPPNKALVVSYFKGKLPTEEDFPKECPYNFQQVMEYKPWLTQSSLE
jgi:hypothetical protein